VETIGTIPFTITVANVVDRIAGQPANSAIRIRQFGDPNRPALTRNEPPLLAAGSTYVVFVQPFTYGPGSVTNQFVIVGGGAGLYLEQAGVLHRLDPYSRQLPETLTLQDLRGQITS
jgi:hypothetical protein